MVKIRGACTLSHEPFPYRNIWDPLFRVFDAFGFNRCMRGTDWTGAVGMLTYEQQVEAFASPTDCSDSERIALMATPSSRSITCRRRNRATPSRPLPYCWRGSCNAREI